MPYEALSEMFSEISRYPTTGYDVSYSGRAAGGNVMDLPVDLQFPAMSGTYLGGGVADWQENRDQYVRQYKGSTYIAIGAIARMAAMQKVKVQRRIIKGNEISYEPVSPTHPLVELLENVNPFDTAWDLWFYTVGWRLLTGDSFLFKAKNGFGVTKQLWPMPSQWVHVIASADEFVSGYQVRSGCGHDFTVPRDCMIQIKNPSLDWEGNGRYYGTPSIKAAAQSIDLENEMWKRLYHQFKNMAPPGMVISTDMRLQPAQARQLWSQLAAQYSMQSHSGRPMLLHSGMKLEGEFSTPGSRELDYKGSLDSVLSYSLAIHGIPKALVGISDGMSRCHDNKTECLTDNGWVTYDKIDHNTKIACYDPETKTLHYSRPTGVFVAPHDGELDCWESQLDSIAVTPNHRMYYNHPSSGMHRFKFGTAEDCSKLDRFQILKAPPCGAACDEPVGVTISPSDPAEKLRIDRSMFSGEYVSTLDASRILGIPRNTIKNWVNRGRVESKLLKRRSLISVDSLCNVESVPNGKWRRRKDDVQVDADLWLEFLGWFVSEGSASHTKRGSIHVKIGQMPGKKCDELDRVMSALPFKASRSVCSTGMIQWVVSDHGLGEHLIRHCGKGAENKKIPQYVKSYPAASLSKLLDAAMLGDGHVQRTGKSWVYVTVSKQLADDIQEIAIKCGKRAFITSQTPGGNRLKSYRVNICSLPTAEIKNKTSHSRIKYQGDVWCVQVPTGLFVVRRDGKAHVSGNSNIESSIWGFAKTTLDPILEHISQHLTQDLAREFDPNLIIKLGPSAVDSHDSLRKDIELLVKAAATTPDEVRHTLMELKPLDGGMGTRPVMVSGFQTVQDPANPDKTVVGRANLAPSNAETSATRSEDDRSQ